jgi:glucuronoarabinoxylan endo-1,4-beta-xylanase
MKYSLFVRVPACVFAIALCGFLFGSPEHAQNVTVSWNNTHQTIDGFGASDIDDAGLNLNLTSAQADLFFSTTNGIGLSLLRTLVPYDGNCSSVNSTCAGQISDMQLAVARGARVWATELTPPASMKSNGSLVCSPGSGTLLSGSYAAFATYLSNHIKSVAAQGISLYALSVQNEPDYCPTYGGALYSGSQLDNFIKNNLGPTLAANGESGVKIMMPEAAHWYGFTNEASTCMNDSACAQYVGVNAFHAYDNPGSISNPYASQGKGFWETEVSAAAGYGPSLCGGCWDPSIADGIMWAKIIDNEVAVGNLNAWHYWWLLGNGFNNEALYDYKTAVLSKRGYIIGNYSKFIRPGWVRIDATHAPSTGVTVSAYKATDGSGKLAIVATNQNGSAATLSFSFSGFTAGSVTPWITDATRNLVQQSAVTAGSGFSYTLPAQSVTTFVSP